MSNKTLHKEKTENAVKEMHSIVQDTQKKLLESEVLISLEEIKDGKTETYVSAEDLFKTLS